MWISARTAADRTKRAKCCCLLQALLSLRISPTLKHFSLIDQIEPRNACHNAKNEAQDQTIAFHSDSSRSSLRTALLPSRPISGGTPYRTSTITLTDPGMHVCRRPHLDHC